jgi:hypothetical protein
MSSFTYKGIISIFLSTLIVSGIVYGSSTIIRIQSQSIAQWDTIANTWFQDVNDSILSQRIDISTISGTVSNHKVLLDWFYRLGSYVWINTALPTSPLSVFWRIETRWYGWGIKFPDWSIQKTAAPERIYVYPTWIRDGLVKDPIISLSFHYGHAMSSVIFSTDESSYTKGAWLKASCDTEWNLISTSGYISPSDSNAEYCWIDSAWWVLSDWSAIVDWIRTSGRDWVCRCQFTPRHEANPQARWWFPKDVCENSAWCSDDIWWDSPYPDTTGSKFRRWEKTFTGTDLRDIEPE